MNSVNTSEIEDYFVFSTNNSLRSINILKPEFLKSTTQN